MNYKLIDMPVHGDKRGKLVAIENLKDIPFEIKRVYYMFDTLPNESRGEERMKVPDTTGRFGWYGCSGWALREVAIDGVDD